MVAHDKTGVGGGSGEWRTPPEHWERWSRRWQFDYDAFATHENALCSTYSTIDGTFIKCPEWYLPHDCEGPDQINLLDGLSVELPPGTMGRRRFGNPPYSRGFMEQATRWFAETRNDFDISVLLVPDARDTRWWREWIAPYATDYPIGRVRFLHPETGLPGGSPPSGHALIVYLPDWLGGRV